MAREKYLQALREQNKLPCVFVSIEVPWHVPRDLIQNLIEIMLHFLAKIGKIPWIKNVTPLIAASASFGYIGFHSYGHKIARNLFAAEVEPGKREEISKDLQNLIQVVYGEIKDKFNQPLFDHPLLDFQPPPIKWFASSTLDPVTFGMTEAKSGVLIGLPNHYNYTKPEDFPSTIRSVKLFKSSSENKKKNEDELLKPDADALGEQETASRLIHIDRHSSHGQDYIKSMLLSEEAKKFSIARELFVGDSYRPLAMCFVLFLSSMLPIYLSRAAVQRFKIADAHLSQRLPFYAVSGMAGLITYYMLGDNLNRGFTLQADEKAMNVNESYRNGAVEYFTKLIQRNKALRDLIDDLKGTYNEEGEIIEPYIRNKYVTLAERLAKAEACKIET